MRQGIKQGQKKGNVVVQVVLASGSAHVKSLLYK